MATRSQDELHRVASSDAGTDERTLYEHTSDDESYDGRPSGEVSKNDHDILDSEDEREKLLTQERESKGFLGRKGSSIKVGKWVKEKTKARRKGGDEESSALMYDIEEGTGSSRTNLISRSSESDEKRLLATESQRKVSEACPLYVWRRLTVATGTEKELVPSHSHIRFCHRAFCRPSSNRI